jgi:hypothetical protein
MPTRFSTSTSIGDASDEDEDWTPDEEDKKPRAKPSFKPNSVSNKKRPASRQTPTSAVKKTNKKQKTSNKQPAKKQPPPPSPSDDISIADSKALGVGWFAQLPWAHDGNVFTIHSTQTDIFFYIMIEVPFAGKEITQNEKETNVFLDVSRRTLIEKCLVFPVTVGHMLYLAADFHNRVHTGKCVCYTTKTTIFVTTSR